MTCPSVRTNSINIWNNQHPIAPNCCQLTYTEPKVGVFGMVAHNVNLRDTLNEYHIDLCASEADTHTQQTLSCGQTFKHAMCGRDVIGTIEVSNQVYQIHEGYNACSNRNEQKMHYGTWTLF